MHDVRSVEKLLHVKAQRRSTHPMQIHISVILYLSVYWLVYNHSSSDGALVVILFRWRICQTLPSHSSISHMRTRSVPAGPGWLWLPLRGGVAGEYHPSACSHTSTSWYQLTCVHIPPGHINPWMVGQPRCCVGPTLPLLSLPHQTRVTAPCCTTTATCHRPWVPPAPTPPPIPTRRAPGTPIDCCPARTRGARHQTSPLKSGYVIRYRIDSGLKSAFISLSSNLRW